MLYYIRSAAYFFHFQSTRSFNNNHANEASSLINKPKVQVYFRRIVYSGLFKGMNLLSEVTAVHYSTLWVDCVDEIKCVVDLDNCSVSRLCRLVYYWSWPNTLQSGRWKVKPIRFDLSAGSCARFGQGNGWSEGETKAKETCVTSVIQ